MATNDSAGEGIMTPLHPNFVWVMRIRGAIAAAVLVFGAVVVDVGLLRETGLRPGLVPILAFLAAVAALVLLPRRRWRAWGYREEEDELHVRSGLLVRVRTVVPFGRVQHIDIAHGPIERQFGLATLILHTAGTRAASVALPGLVEAEAEAMRDRIRAKIRQDLV